MRRREIEIIEGGQLLPYLLSDTAKSATLFELVKAAHGTSLGGPIHSQAKISASSTGSLRSAKDKPWLSICWGTHYPLPPCRFSGASITTSQSNYVGRAEAWDEIATEGDIMNKDCVLRFKSNGRVSAIASIFRDLESLEAELLMEQAPA